MKPGEFSPERSEFRVDSPRAAGSSCLSALTPSIHRYKDPDSPVPHCKKQFRNDLKARTRSSDDKDRWEAHRTQKGFNFPKREHGGVVDLLSHPTSEELVGERERRLVDDATFRRTCEVNSLYAKVHAGVTDAVTLRTDKQNSSSVADCLNWK
jgi:hypothetical protein